MKEELNPTELAKRKKVSRETVYNWIKEGCPMVTKNPSRLYIEDVNEWLNRRGK